MKTQFIVNKDKGRVVCLVETKRGLFRGIAKLNPEDEWNEDKGRIIAGLKVDIAILKDKRNRVISKYNSLIAQADQVDAQEEVVSKQIELIETKLRLLFKEK